MNKRIEVSEITMFLEEAKELISAGKYDFVPRKKNMKALARLGLTIADIKEEIIGLVVGDYYKGPKKDFEGNGNVWEFKKEIDDIQLYVKLKIVSENGNKFLKCLSFHEDDFGQNGGGKDEKIL